jgi:uncharacterized protein (TIGR02646 family)
MIEIVHKHPQPSALLEFLTANDQSEVTVFNSKDFHSVKRIVKASLNEDQGGLCAYCEKEIGPNEGQVDHIKPKGGPNAHPHLCFSYTNYAHSCISNKRCGQKKGDGLLPIEPTYGCNAKWQLSTDGTIEPRIGLGKADKHAVSQTLGMLGLNSDAGLVDERRQWLRNTIEILQSFPVEADSFLAAAPFREILSSSLGLTIVNRAEKL